MYISKVQDAVTHFKIREGFLKKATANLRPEGERVCTCRSGKEGRGEVRKFSELISLFWQHSKDKRPNLDTLCGALSIANKWTLSYNGKGQYSYTVILSTLAVKNSNFLLNDGGCKHKSIKIHFNSHAGIRRGSSCFCMETQNCPRILCLPGLWIF